MASAQILLIVLLGVLALTSGFPAEGLSAPVKRLVKDAVPPKGTADLEGSASSYWGGGWGWGGYGGWGYGGWGYPYWGSYYGGYPYWGGYYSSYYPWSYYWW